MKAFRHFLLCGLLAAGCFLLASGTAARPYRELRKSWDLQSKVQDSLSFFTADTLKFYERAPFVPDIFRSSLSLSSSDKRFSLVFRSGTIRGFYKLNRFRKRLTLTLCSRTEGEPKSWIKGKSYTFVIDKLTRYELVLHPLR